MTWYKLEEEQAHGIINICWKLLMGAGLILLYIQNPFWQYFTFGTIIFLSGYGGYLYSVHDRKKLQDQIKIDKEIIGELEKELKELKKK